MSQRFPVFFLWLLFFVTAARAAEDPAEPPFNKNPLVLDPYVVSEKLDRARDTIVPSLGAAEFHIDRIQLDAAAPGVNAGFNEVLLRVPGVAQDSFGQVHVRGEHANLQYRINDVLLPEGLTGFGQELDTRFVETVSVLTGALPAQYGYRTAGVVDIHTRTSASTGGDAALYAGSFGTMRASLEATDTRGDLGGYVSASAERNDLGVENPTDRRDAIHDHKTQQKAFAYISYVIDPTSRFNVMFSGSFARFQIPNNPGQAARYTLAGVPNFDSAHLDENQREENHYLVVAFQKSTTDFAIQISAFTRYSLVAFRPDHDGDLIFNGVASRVHRSLVGNGVETNAKWSLVADHTFRGGIIATSTNANTRTLTSVFPTDANGNEATSTPFDLADDQHKLGWLYGAYLQDEWKLAERLTLNYGARADAYQGYLKESQVSPRLNLVYQLNDLTSLHAGYARYFTPPPLELIQDSTLSKFSGTTNQPAGTTNSPVRSERAQYFDVGVSEKLSSKLSATLDGYYKRADNLLDEGQFGQALIFLPFNYRQGRVYGVELSGNYTNRGFSAFLNAAVSQAQAREIVSGEFNFGADQLAYIASHDVHLDHDQLYTASTGFSYRFKGTLLYTDILYGSGLRRGFANTEKLPAYSPLNLGTEHTFKLAGHRELHARLDVVNVLDAVYELRDGSGIGVGAPQFGSRRGVFGGLTLVF
jgi:outer membrane receptor protein involved in Fe transport